MRDLYYQSDAVLRGADASVIAASSAEEARENGAGRPAIMVGLRIFAAHAARLPRNYWTGFDTEMHVRTCRAEPQLPRPGRAASG
jgi:hypothetical protein